MITNKIIDSNLILADGYDKAIIGIYDDNQVAYSITKIINILCERDGMSENEALEFYDYNIKPSKLHNNMPIYIDDSGEEQ